MVVTLQTENRLRGRAVVARRAHNPEVVGSNPSPATKFERDELPYSSLCV